MLLTISNTEFQQFTGANTGLKTDDIQDSIDTVFKRQILPYLSQDQLDDSKDSTDEKHLELMKIVHRAASNLAVAKDYMKFVIQLEKGGVKDKSAKEAKASKEDKEQHREDFYIEGNQSIEDMILFLEHNQDIFTKWKNSPAYSQRAKSFVNTATVFNEYIDISHSRRVFMKLKPHLKRVEDIHILNLINNSLLEKLLESYNEGTQSPLEERLIGYLQAFICYLAISDAIVKGAVIKDKYNTFSTYDDTALGKTKGHKTADLSFLQELEKRYFDSSKDYLNSFNTLVEANLDVLNITQKEPETGLLFINKPEKGYIFI